ncbi:D-methionine ABC transporter permease [Escherichia coli]|uniref:D-methionine transport system permease protein MetI n=1 Tax=Escherichia coli TaxID=562 RepID=A0A377KCC1_ECOLX|nr:D-methionine ABC transporter permease [Escherichia coli]
MVENALLEIPTGLIEASRAMGATPMQIVRKVLLPEALPGLVNAATITLITLVGYFRDGWCSRCRWFRSELAISMATSATTRR